MFWNLNITYYSYILYPKLQTQVSVSNTNSVAFALPELTLSCIVRQSRSYFCAWIEWRLPINSTFLRLVSFLCQFYTSWINFNCVFLQFSGPKWNSDREWIGTSAYRADRPADQTGWSLYLFFFLQYENFWTWKCFSKIGGKF